MATVRIDRLDIHMVGIPPGAAQAGAEGLGMELLERVAQRAGRLKWGSAADIREINAGTLQVSEKICVEDLRGEMVTRIAERLENVVNEKGKRGQK